VNYQLSDHARQELERRKIPLALLEQILTKPEQTVPETAGRTAYQSRHEMDGKMFLIRVIVDPTPGLPIVVTVYRTTKIKKYWKAP
jgi:Domain of unknown function (DUF4258)